MEQPLAIAASIEISVHNALSGESIGSINLFPSQNSCAQAKHILLQEGGLMHGRLKEALEQSSERALAQAAAMMDATKDVDHHKGNAAFEWLHNFFVFHASWDKANQIKEQLIHLSDRDETKFHAACIEMKKSLEDSLVRASDIDLFTRDEDGTIGETVSDETPLTCCAIGIIVKNENSHLGDVTGVNESSDVDDWLALAGLHDDGDQAGYFQLTLQVLES
jgi:hypothetical protein